MLPHGLGRKGTKTESHQGAASEVSAADLRTVKQVTEVRPAFTEPSLRWLIFNAGENGFGPCVVKLRRRVFIDLEAFDQYLEDHRVAPFCIGHAPRPSEPVT